MDVDNNEKKSYISFFSEFWTVGVMLYQKATQNAIAAVSRLAELYHDPAQRASSRDIAESRNLPMPIVAKILTELSRGGLITGSPGPGGGYRLARPPHEISLQDVANLFERDVQSACPYGPGWCGSQAPCPLHASMIAMRQQIDEYLASTHFGVFEPKKEKATKSARVRASTKKS